MDRSPRILALAFVLLLHQSIPSLLALDTSTPASGTQWQNEALQGNVTVLTSGNFSLVLGRASPTEEGPCTLAVQHLPSALQVWIANFYNATTGSSSSSSPNCSLALQKNGDLQLRENGSLAWNTGTASSGVKSMQLLESGNLVLLNGTNSNFSTVWQSFDHPSDTLIIGQRLNLHASMFAAAAGAPYGSGGIYSMAVSNYSNDLLLYAHFDQPSGAEIYWSMEATFSGPQNAWVCCSGSFVEVSNGLTVYDSSSQSIVSTSSNNLNPHSEFFEFARLESDGNLRSFVFRGGIWQLNFQALTTACQHPDACGQFGVCSSSSSSSSCSSVCLPGFHLANASDPSQGCTSPGLLPSQNQCTATNSTAVTMMNATGYTYFSAQDFYNGESQANYSSLDDCELSCLRNCSCQSVFFKNDSGSSFGSCYVMEYPIRTLQHSNDPTQLVFIKLRNDSSSLAPAPAPAPSPKRSSSTTAGGASASPIASSSHSRTLAIAVSVAAVAIFIVLIGLVACFIKKRKRTGQGVADDEMYLETLPGLPPRFSYKALQEATNGFANKLGAGGFGAVYEGMLTQPHRIRVAVKELKDIHRAAGTKQFRAEVATLGSIAHRHLVRLCGYCMEGSHRLLVYEFMENGSLDQVLFHKDAEALLDWPKRCAIALGTAQGLAYLHEECTSRIIHCDIKPENILLDKQWNAKVSDFGLAKPMSRDASYAVTTMRGTRGYLAPEWLKNAAITERSDVFSYGIMLLELVGGRRSFDVSQKECYLPAWAFELLEKGADLMELADPRLQKEILEEEEERVQRMVKVALWCIQEDPAARPSMSWVVKVLEAAHGTQDLASPPPCSFFAKAKPYFPEADHDDDDDDDDDDDASRPQSEGDEGLSHRAQSELSWQMSTLVSGR